MWTAYAELELELKRGHTSSKVKAMMAIMRDRIEQAKLWQDSQGAVQGAMFDDVTPKEPIGVPYSDTNHSLKAAGAISSSGRAVVYEEAVLRILWKRGSTCREVVELFRKRDIDAGRDPGQWHSPVSARICDLKNKGLVMVAGSRETTPGKTGGVNHLTALGRARVEAMGRG